MTHKQQTGNHTTLRTDFTSTNHLLVNSQLQRIDMHQIILKTIQNDTLDHVHIVYESLFSQ